MINDIINAITIKLYELFEGCDVYAETIEQGLTEPCFLVVLVNDSLKNYLGTRGRLNTTFDIHYFPQNKAESKAEMNSVKVELYSNMDFITCVNGDVLRGTNMNANIINDGTGDVLHFFVDYNVPTNKEKAIEEYMRTLSQERSVTDGN